jgi:hypothetical protein
MLNPEGEYVNQDQNTTVSELNSEEEPEILVWKPPEREFETPLFLRDSLDEQKGDAQDEKNKTAE